MRSWQGEKQRQYCLCWCETSLFKCSFPVMTLRIAGLLKKTFILYFILFCGYNMFFSQIPPKWFIFLLQAFINPFSFVKKGGLLDLLYS